MPESEEIKTLRRSLVAVQKQINDAYNSLPERVRGGSLSMGIYCLVVEITKSEEARDALRNHLAVARQEVVKLETENHSMKISLRHCHDCENFFKSSIKEK